MKKLYPSIFLAAIVISAIAATIKISDLPISTSPSTNTFIEIADMNAATKSSKYLLTNLVTVAQGQASTNALTNTFVLKAGDSMSGALTGPSSTWTNGITAGDSTFTSTITITNDAISDVPLQINALTGTTNAVIDVKLAGARQFALYGEAANTMSQRNGTSAQQQSWYGTYTDSSNFRNATWGWQKNANAFTLTTTNAGTAAGTGGSIIFAPLGTTAMTVNTNSSVSVGNTGIYTTGIGNSSTLSFFPDNAAQAAYQMNINGMALGSARWIGWSPVANATVASADIYLTRGATGVLSVIDSSGNYGTIRSGGLQAGQTKVLTDATATSAFYLSVPNTNALGGEVFWTVSATDGTDTQQQTGRTQFGAVGKSTTVTADLTTRTNAAQVSAGTLTVDVIKNVATNNVFALQFNADTSLTTTNLVLKWRLETPSTYTVNSL